MNISKYSIDHHEVIEESKRFDDIQIEKNFNCFNEANWSRFYIDDVRVIDYGNYGVFDTITNEKLFNHPDFDDKIIDIIDDNIYLQSKEKKI